MRLSEYGKEDMQLNCAECGAVFCFTTSEQLFFQEKGLRNQPKRCANCRVINRSKRKAKDADFMSAITEVTCASCASPTKVPFTPKGHKPVYCYRCMHSGLVPGSPAAFGDQPPASA